MRAPYWRAGAVQRYGAPSSMGDMGSLWDVISDAADAVGSAASWVAHGVADVVDALKKVPGLGAVVGLVQDFGNTGLGKVFFSFVAPGLLSAVFSSLPGVGIQFAEVLGNPIFQNMLPGLVRGERIDRAFIASTKTVMNRILSNGGAPAEAKQFLGDGLAVITDTLKSAGIDTAQIADVVKRGGEIAQSIKDRAEAIVGPQLAALARATGIPEDMLRTSLDGILRVKQYENWLYDKATGFKLTDLAELATAGHEWTQGTIDAWLTNPHIGHAGQEPIFFGASDVLFMAQTPGAGGEENEGPAMFGGMMGQVDLPYIYSRIHALAAAGQRPDELEPAHARDAGSRTMLSRFQSDARIAARTVSARSLGPVSTNAPPAARTVQTTTAPIVAVASVPLSRATIYTAAGGGVLLMLAFLLLSPRKG